ncbi:MAG: BON domain-containing protein [Terracidiphilus sp.]
MLAGALLCLSQIAFGAGNPGAQAQQGNAAAMHAAVRLKGKQFSRVNVTVNNGVATLTGSVNLYEYKEKAGSTAKGTKGVTAVENEIQVAGPEVSDAQLEKKLAPALAYNRVGYNNMFDAITLKVENGMVTLGGHSHDYPNRNAALALVATTPGVKGLTDDIQVDPPSTMDWRIRREEARAIYGDPTLNRYALNPVKPIRISVQNGHVELYGTVDSKMDKQIANMRASQVPGVFGVKDYLQVTGQPSTNGMK